MNKPEESHSTGPCYVVEARMAMDLPPREVADQIVDGQWRRMRFSRAPEPFGVPNSLWDLDIARLGYYGYETAMALAYWLAAEASTGSCIEIRLVEYTYQCSHTISRVGEEPTIQTGGLAYQARKAKASRG